MLYHERNPLFTKTESETNSNRDVSRDYLGIAVFIGRVTKREAEGIATLRSSDNIRCHNKI